MRFGIVKNGVIVNVIEIDSSNHSPDLELVELPDGFGIGDLYESATGEFSHFKETVNESKKKKLSEINKWFIDRAAVIKNGIVQEEIDTFDTQEKEALAYQANNQAEVPLIAGLSAVRKMEVSELAIRVLAHAAAYKAAMAQAMGKKHAFEDQVKAATTIEDLEKIVV